MVLLAKTEQELKKMMKRLRKFLEKIGLSLSPEKSKVIEKGRGRLRKRKWQWGEEEIEEAKEIKYLGYILQKNGGAEKHICERVKRTIIAMKKTWSIGERLFRDNFMRRMKMFESLVESVALYGPEIWGWQYDNRLDGIKRKYVKWILGLDKRTPNYILVKETKIREIKMRAVRRTIRYEGRARLSKKKIVRECIRELDRVKWIGEESRWERRRRELVERTGRRIEQLRENMETNLQEILGNTMEELERIEKSERERKIKDNIQ